MIFVNLGGHIVGTHEERCGDTLSGHDGGECQAKVTPSHDRDADGIWGFVVSFHVECTGRLVSACSVGRRSADECISFRY